MAYKSILTLWDGKNSTKAAIRDAIALTKESRGHLHILCPAFSTVKAAGGFPFADIPASVSEAEHNRLSDKVLNLKKEAEQIANSEDIFFSIETAVLNRDELPVLMDHVARFADLTVLPQPYGAERTESDELITESALLTEHCPVLVVPPVEVHMPNGRTMVAWDGSREALRATKRAMPLLEQATVVDVMIVSKKPEKTLDEQMSSDIATFLARHRINVEINVIAKSGETIPNLIIDRVKNTGANLVVMGGYGHSPFREFLFGGATRRMLEACSVPIFMAH
jgi:nucleotide-binding universal stress UspA family protein